MSFVCRSHIVTSQIQSRRMVKMIFKFNEGSDFTLRRNECRKEKISASEEYLRCWRVGWEHHDDWKYKCRTCPLMLLKAVRRSITLNGKISATGVFDRDVFAPIDWRMVVIFRTKMSFKVSLEIRSSLVDLSLTTSGKNEVVWFKVIRDTSNDLRGSWEGC